MRGSGYATTSPWFVYFALFFALPFQKISGTPYWTYASSYVGRWGGGGRPSVHGIHSKDYLGIFGIFSEEVVEHIPNIPSFSSFQNLLETMEYFWILHGTWECSSLGCDSRLYRAWAQGRSRAEYPVSALVSPGAAPPQGGGGGALLAVWRNTAPLFRGRHLRNTALMCLVLFATISRYSPLAALLKPLNH